jgi:hypothetical protein
MAEPENLVLDHLRAIRGEMAKMGQAMQSLNVEVTAIRQHIAGFMTSRNTITAISPRSRFGSSRWRSGWNSRTEAAVGLQIERTNAG